MSHGVYLGLVIGSWAAGLPWGGVDNQWHFDVVVCYTDIEENWFFPLPAIISYK